MFLSDWPLYVEETDLFMMAATADAASLFIAAAGMDDKSLALCPCLICSESFNIADEAGRQFLLRHLLTSHHVVIGEVEEVLDLPAYCTYWHERLKGVALTEVMSVIRTNSKPVPPSTPPKFVPKQELYYLLNKVLPEDASLRQEIAVKTALRVQEGERRESTASRLCLFCSHSFTGNRSLVIRHLLDVHGFNLGKPDNLVFVDQFLALLRKKLDDCVCLYCERTFRDRLTLKEHVRKKHHRRINPENKEYDRFFMVNYGNGGEIWQAVKAEQVALDDEEDDDKDDDEARADIPSAAPLSSLPLQAGSPGSIQLDEPVLSAISCLFCVHSALDMAQLNAHMLSDHGFDLLAALSSVRFYWRMRLVNFIRHRVNERCCILCAKKCDTRVELLQHMTTAMHYRMPEKDVWSDVHYLFPTDENDALLQQLAEMDDSDDEADDEEGAVAVPEDLAWPDDEVMALAMQVREGL